MTVLDHVFVATFTMLGAGVLCILYGVVRGPSVLDRIVCLNAMSVLVVSAMAAEAALRGDSAYIGLMVTVALLGFVGTLTAARFAERRAHDRG
ncbi:multisubunit sodium/proton antiporter MrpF subunit [Murinocardiopsis flavida]|uniref:Multisubunit sodium/proton antiporter MrpF subunit n=1 Tax=Murinocardiopsis flavida TaxID=645275 RepID=A0A2P8DTW9_9ACTN|nr:monovalent cation/H+ antiporter complex subunit F [Murinocardiopsis flavida]PSL00668.1 multisubunit sodium/proton antiporter MrpF subunit [Murinocardiopsis flavida]